MVDRGIATALLGIGALMACGTSTGPDASSSSASAKPPPPPPTTSSSSPSNDPPSSSGALVLRWRITGGFAGLGGPGSVPEFSLYGDGRALVPGKGQASLLTYKLKPEALKRLLNAARSAGLDHPRTVEDPNVSDSTILQVLYGSTRTRIWQPEARQADPAVRFVKRLDPSGWLPADLAEPGHDYTLTRLAVVAGEMGQTGGRQATRWPLAPLGRGEQAAGGLCTVIKGADVATATRLARSARPDTAWESGGKVYSIRFRPMLPEEQTCREMAAS